VLVIDETGDVKKGTATPGVQRQYTGPPPKQPRAGASAATACSNGSEPEHTPANFSEL
jgi:SRSO17 transposase